MAAIQVTSMAIRSESFQSSGVALRQIRYDLGLTLRDVHAASMRLAKVRGNRRFALSPSGLHEIETMNRVPSVYALNMLAIVYKLPLDELLKVYGIKI
jgi:transcriptional regulator with XRE-family HTH domain